MSDTDTAQWPPPPMHPSVEVLEVGYVRLVRTEDRLTLSDLTTGRSFWAGLLGSFLFVPFFIGMIILMAIAVTNGRAASDGSLHRLLVHEFWSKRLQYACITVFFMAFWWLLNFINRNCNLFTLDKQRNMFQNTAKIFTHSPRR